ncbi:MAG: hypothetical protein PHE21_01790 [Candidatus Dojkabacteria bacterium]|nr:hypothetical protein [Candidatus Dojkabacteria bacterium]
METDLRVTTKKKSNKIVKTLLIITAILGIGLLAVAIYFYTIADISKDADVKTNSCGCYYIDPAVISQCGDPRRGFIFETATVPSTQTCKASCSTSKLSTNILNSTTEQDLYQICQLPSITDLRCTEMTIKDGDGKIVTGKVDANEELVIEAKFDSGDYLDQEFVINNETITPDNISTDKLTIKKTISNLGNNTTLNIVAQAKDINGEQINSPVCRRLIDINQEGVSNITALQIQTRSVETSIKISRIKITAGNIDDDAKLTLTFSFDDNDYSTLIMTDGFTADSTKGEIEIVEQDLYDTNNFSNKKSFSILTSHQGELEITANVKDDGISLGSASKSITFPQIEDDSEAEAETTPSNFSVTKESDISCVERVSPNNDVLFTLTSRNNSTVNQSITSVKDKLPLGFTYVANSSEINGVAVTDASYVTVTNIGSSQEVVWAKNDNWSISSGQSLVIEFRAIAGVNALTGDNINEVIITPIQIPSDPSSLRTTLTIDVQQDCDNPVEDDEDEGSTPQTGIFDSVVTKLILGILTITFGWYMYSKPAGRVIAEKLVNSGVYKGAEMTAWRIFKPKKYFEQRLISKIQKRKSN